MSRESDLSRVLECGIVAVVRFSDPAPLVDVMRALADGGVTVAEVTFTVPNAIDVIREAKRQLGDRVLLGAGTVLDTETARAAILAGADIVKVFPADVLGPAFFKALRGPLPQVKLMPTGGVDLITATEFLAAGACCLGIGGQLVDPKAIAAKDFAAIRTMAERYTAIVKAFRNR